MTGVFLIATQRSNFESLPFFFYRKSNFVRKTNIFRKKVLHEKINEIFFLFALYIFFHTGFCMACLCMLSSMSDNLKIQIFKIIVVEKIRQILKVCYFCYIICEDSSKTIQVVF